SYVLFPVVAKEFFEWRERAERGEVPPVSLEESHELTSPERAPVEFNITVHGEQYHVQIAGRGEETAGGKTFFIRLDGRLEEVVLQPIREVDVSGSGYELPEGAPVKPKRPRPRDVGDITSPISGKVVSVKVGVGQEIKEGDVLLVVEAMKMENEIHSPVDGVVEEILVQTGENVDPDEVLVRVKPKKI
ncbi:MAG TPA: biotin/lipoyl-binding protein, partial [Aquifex aeolicus]|nr:biotin/lipoyl-binding protein [Aquifex aeolicus]